MKRLLLILTLVLFCSCLGSKKVAEKSSETKSTEKTEVKKDSSSTTTINEGIKDRVVINVPEADNEATMKSLDAILKLLNTSKTSGSNSYHLKYDEQMKQLILDVVVAATQNKETVTNSDTNTETSFEQRTDEYIKKKITAIPWWVYLVAVIIFIRPILNFLAMFFPGLKTISILSRFFK